VAGLFTVLEVGLGRQADTVVVDLSPALLVAQPFVDDAEIVDLTLLQRLVVKLAEPFEINGVLAVKRTAMAGPESAMLHARSPVERPNIIQPDVK
jgi:hypothetical protein